MKDKNHISHWRDVDISLCFFNALVCGLLSFNNTLHFLGAITLIMMIVPIIWKKLYYTDIPISKIINVAMISIRVILCILLFVGLTMNYLYLKNLESPF